MSRESALLAVLTCEPARTSELYQRVGYAQLTVLGLVSYDAFRAELARLSAAGLAESDSGRDGATMWRLADATGAPASEIPHRPPRSGSH
jgi:hypothetical protein